ncbi:MAG: (Fe-S)-binding protein [Chloroflexota bacterium]
MNKMVRQVGFTGDGSGEGRPLDSCIRCGSCAAVCPTYREEPSERLSARGRVSLLRKFGEGEIGHTELFDASIFSCVLCGACRTVCPLGIEVTGDMYEARKRLWKADRKRRLIGHAIRLVFRAPGFSYSVLKSLVGIGDLLPVKALRPFRGLNEMGLSLPAATLRSGGSLFKAAKARGRIAVMAGCTVNYIYPGIGASLIKVLNSLRYDVILPQGEVCCGAPHLAMGLTGEAERMAEQNVRSFMDLHVEGVVSPCPTCVHGIKTTYRGLVGGGIDNAFDATEFLALHGEELPGLREGGQNRSSDAQRGDPLRTAVYHDPCHSVNYLGIREQPRRILRSLSYTPVEPREKGCCGFGGTFRLLNRDLSRNMLRRKAVAWGDAEMIVTACPNCVLQLSGGFRDKPVRHLVEVVAERLGLRGRG